MSTESRKHGPPGRSPQPPREEPRIGVDAPSAGHLHAQDHWRVNVAEGWEVSFWAREFACSEEDLRRAVQEVGSLAGDVRAHLGARKEVKN